MILTPSSSIERHFLDECISLTKIKMNKAQRKILDIKTVELKAANPNLEIEYSAAAQKNSRKWKLKNQLK